MDNPILKVPKDGYHRTSGVVHLLFWVYEKYNNSTVFSTHWSCSFLSLQASVANI